MVSGVVAGGVDGVAGSGVAGGVVGSGVAGAGGVAGVVVAAGGVAGSVVVVVGAVSVAVSSLPVNTPENQAITSKTTTIIPIHSAILLFLRGSVVAIYVLLDQRILCETTSI